MENKLSNFFPFSPESNLGSSFILCIDDGAFSGACAFHELLFKSLKDGKKVHIISVTHSRSHYEAVLRKQALDLRQLELAGRIAFQFPIVSFSNSVTNTGATVGSYTWDDLVRWQKAGMPFRVPSSPLSSEQQLQEETITSATTALNNDYVLCIDDLEALEVVAPSAQASRSFLSYILMHIKPIVTTESITAINTATVSSINHDSTNQSTITTVIAYGRQNPYSSSSSQQSPIRSGNITSFSSGYGENIFFPSCLQGSLYNPGHGHNAGFEPMLSEYLRYRADATIRIQPLTSGYSSEVHGIITITVHSSLQGIIPPSDNESQNSHGTRNIPGSIGIRENKVSAAGTGTLILHYKALDTGIRCTLSSKK